MNTFRYNFVKGLLVVLVTIILLPCGSAKAQTIQSAQYKLNRKGTYVIVRESATGVPVLVSRQLYDLNTCTNFMYGDMQANSVREFWIDDTITLTGVTSHNVNDMCVVGDMCYFCGVRRHAYSEPDPETGAILADSTGFFGRFRLDPSGFGSTVSYDIRYVKNVKSLERMDMYTTSGDTALAMVGVGDASTYRSCLMVARIRHLNDPSPWHYRILLTGTDTTEVFTDVAVNSRHTVVASYHRANGGNGYFCLRRALNDDLYNEDDYTGFDYRYGCRTNPLGGCARFVRSDYADVRLNAVPWTKKVYAAFSCSMNACTTDHHQTALCEINTNDMELRSVQVVQKLYRNPTTLWDTKYLYKTYGDEGTASVALLHHLTGDEYSTVVEYPFALTTSYTGPVPRALVQLMEKGRLQSVSGRVGNDVRFGGQFGDVATTNVTYLQEILPSINDGSMCMQNDKADVVVIDSVQTLLGCPKQLYDITEGMKSFQWTTKVVGIREPNAENTCIY